MSAILFALLMVAAAQEPSPGPSPSASPSRAEKPAEAKPEKSPEPPVVTHHQIQAGGRTLAYTVTTGMMPLKSDQGEIEADIFFMAYTADRPSGTRPLMFSFNGGPGSSSVWLHMGALGPRRVRMLDDGGLPPPPYQLVDNEHTWLDFTDLVFIDPVGTGFSRATKPELGKKFWSVEGDIQSVGEFIRLYLTKYERWNSPLFLIGESYGTTRAAGLAGHLVDRGIALNGVVLISTILNFQTARFNKGNDLPYVLFLPTYSAIAWYHKKLPAEMQQRPLADLLSEVEGWAVTGYLEALGKGDRLSAAERQAAIDRLSRYTGLERRFIDNSELRIEIQRFTKELLRDQKRTVGRLDGRFKGMDVMAASERPDFDPSMAAIRPPYTALFNHYVRTALGYKNDSVYYILGGGIGQWDFNVPGGGFADTSEALRSGFAKNPYMKLFVAEGYYDLATPYFATEYTLSHMGLDPAVRGNVTTGRYEAGHMMYIDTRELAKLRRDGEAFVRAALAHKQ
jgi:carboxypeptidase C (cathepsin A)